MEALSLGFSTASGGFATTGATAPPSRELWSPVRSLAAFTNALTFSSEVAPSQAKNSAIGRNLPSLSAISDSPKLSMFPFTVSHLANACSFTALARCSRLALENEVRPPTLSPKAPPKAPITPAAIYSLNFSPMLSQTVSVQVLESSNTALMTSSSAVSVDSSKNSETTPAAGPNPFSPACLAALSAASAIPLDKSLRVTSSVAKSSKALIVAFLVAELPLALANAILDAMLPLNDPSTPVIIFSAPGAIRLKTDVAMKAERPLEIPPMLAFLVAKS